MSDKLGQELKHEAVEKISSSRNNRRKLLKGVVAVPIVMTLNTAVAQQVARTSNMISATGDPAAAVKDTNGNLLCIDVRGSATVQTDNGVVHYDVGNGSGELTVNYQDSNDPQKDFDRQAAACQSGGGIIVSASALSSITGITGNIT